MGHFENGRWINIDPKLRAWYEEDIKFIDDILRIGENHKRNYPGFRQDEQRIEWLMRERKRRVELIGNSE